MKKTSSKYAILGVLSIRPMSGYDIRKWILDSIGNFWSESYGQIYPMLDKLVQEKSVLQIDQEEKGKTDRKVYKLTAKGRRELKRWLQSEVAIKQNRNELLLKLFFGEEVPVETNIAHLEKFRVYHTELLRKYQTIEEEIADENAQDSNAIYWLLTISYGKHVSNALLNWSEESIKALQSADKNSPRQKNLRPNIK